MMVTPRLSVGMAERESIYEATFAAALSVAGSNEGVGFASIRCHHK